MYESKYKIEENNYESFKACFLETLAKAISEDSELLALITEKR